MGKDISEYYWYDDADDRLEGMFGKTRTVEHGHNFDMVQFEERASELMRLEEIYARNPDLRKGSRRLSGPLFDHVNPVSIGKQAVSLQGVSLPGCWIWPVPRTWPPCSLATPCLQRTSTTGWPCVLF